MVQYVFVVLYFYSFVCRYIYGKLVSCCVISIHHWRGPRVEGLRPQNSFPIKIFPKERANTQLRLDLFQYKSTGLETQHTSWFNKNPNLCVDLYNFASCVCVCVFLPSDLSFMMCGMSGLVPRSSADNVVPR